MSDRFKPARLAVLISGHGSNLQALINHSQAGRLPADIIQVISNQPHAYGLQRATQAGIASVCLPSQGLPRESYDQALIAQLRQLEKKDPLDWIVLAGFMRILTPAFIQAFANRIVNIHPSLLPAYKGLNTHQRVLADQQSLHGCSVHQVTAELDEGPLLGQASLTINPTESAADLARRVNQLEQQLYPLVLFGLCSKQIYSQTSTSSGWQTQTTVTHTILNTPSPLHTTPNTITLHTATPVFLQALADHQLNSIFQDWLHAR